MIIQGLDPGQCAISAWGVFNSYLCCGRLRAAVFAEEQESVQGQGGLCCHDVLNHTLEMEQNEQVWYPGCDRGLACCAKIRLFAIMQHTVYLCGRSLSSHFHVNDAMLDHSVPLNITAQQQYPRANM